MPVHRATLTTVDNGHKPIIKAYFGSRTDPYIHQVTALIDTGAELSSAPRPWIDALKLECVGAIDMYGHGGHYLGKRKCFKGSLAIRSNDPPQGDQIIDCIFAEGDSGNADILIGMSALRVVKTTFYPGNQFTIEWEAPAPQA